MKAILTALLFSFNAYSNIVIVNEGEYTRALDYQGNKIFEEYKLKELKSAKNLVGYIQKSSNKLLVYNSEGKKILHYRVF